MAVMEKSEIKTEWMRERDRVGEKEGGKRENNISKRLRPLDRQAARSVKPGVPGSRHSHRLTDCWLIDFYQSLIDCTGWLSDRSIYGEDWRTNDSCPRISELHHVSQLGNWWWLQGTPEKEKKNLFKTPESLFEQSDNDKKASRNNKTYDKSRNNNLRNV